MPAWRSADLVSSSLLRCLCCILLIPFKTEGQGAGRGWVSGAYAGKGSWWSEIWHVGGNPQLWMCRLRKGHSIYPVCASLNHSVPIQLHPWLHCQGKTLKSSEHGRHPCFLHCLLVICSRLIWAKCQRGSACKDYHHIHSGLSASDIKHWIQAWVWVSGLVEC